MSGDKISSEDVELRALLIKAAGAGFAAYADSTTKAYQEHDDRRTGAEFIADAVLAALAGRLLPAGGSEQIEGGYEMPGNMGVMSLQGWSSHPPTHRRTVTEWPDGSVLTGPWLPVEEGTQP